MSSSSQSFAPGVALQEAPSATQHSAGPWAIELSSLTGYGDDGISSLTIQDGSPDRWCIAAIISDVSDIPAEANARLIAACPELLEALKALHDLAADTLSSIGIEQHSVLRQAFVAIAKAEGRP